MENINKTIINIRLKWYKTTIKSKIIEEIGTNYQYSINNATKKFLEISYGISTKILPMNYNVKEIKQLYISSWDNRSHHLYDHLQLINNTPMIIMN